MRTISSVLCEQRHITHHNTNCMLQDVAQETLARTPIPPGKMDRHLSQSRTAKAAVLQSRLINSRGDTRHQLLTMLE